MTMRGANLAVTRRRKLLSWIGDLGFKVSVLHSRRPAMTAGSAIISWSFKRGEVHKRGSGLSVWLGFESKEFRNTVFTAVHYTLPPDRTHSIQPTACTGSVPTFTKARFTARKSDSHFTKSSSDSRINSPSTRLMGRG
jgi:hypothetical protein